ncbi:lectin-like domain-containing protein [Isobaculum melis]|uniref:Conserved repeat domain-containing protein n=1 Tax=Isobaculum melis TaxID=142588 RepID=A0A1H9TYZ5_9LACT|nr:DUF11 domain-containing protein [Isobaculum melis]SES02231.1 conserved repeat domain-containing protein [Isobaculum melis]
MKIYKFGLLFFFLSMLIFIGIQEPKKVLAFDMRYSTSGFPEVPDDAKNSNVNVSDAFTIVTGSNSYVDSINQNMVVLIPNVPIQRGAIWYNYQLDLTQDFSFEGYVFNGYQGGSDGLTFTFHNDPRGIQAIGNFAGGLGAYGTTFHYGDDVYIKNALSLEIDIYKNQAPDKFLSDTPLMGVPADSLVPHAALIVPGTGNQLSTTNKHMDIVYPKTRAEQNLVWATPNNLFWNPLKISWDSANQIFSWKYAHFEEKSRQIDPQLYFGSTKVWWGFTGASGGLPSPEGFIIKKLPQTPHAEVSKKVRNISKKETLFSNVTYSEIGDVLEYQIEVENLADSVVPLVNTVLSDELKGTEFILGSLKVDQLSVANPAVDANNTFQVNLNKLEVNQSKKITFQVKVNQADENATILNEATLTSTYSEKQLSNQTKVIVAPKLNLKKAVDKSQIPLNGELTYTLTLTNDATAGKWKGSLTDTLAADLSYVAGSITYKDPLGVLHVLPDSVWVSQNLTVADISLNQGEAISVTFTAKVDLKEPLTSDRLLLNQASYIGLNVDETINFNGVSNVAETAIKTPIIHLRQVILQETVSLPVPVSGYYQIEHVKPTDLTEKLMSFSNKSPSGLLVDNPAYNEVTLSLPTEQSKVVIQPIQPQYYEYDGFTLTTKEQQHQPENRNKNDAILLEFRQDSEYWLTVYLKPTTEQPKPYSWFYSGNQQLGKLQP